MTDDVFTLTDDVDEIFFNIPEEITDEELLEASLKAYSAYHTLDKIVGLARAFELARFCVLKSDEFKRLEWWCNAAKALSDRSSAMLKERAEKMPQ